jgi:hypothetical protein
MELHQNLLQRWNLLETTPMSEWEPNPQEGNLEPNKHLMQAFHAFEFV